METKLTLRIERKLINKAKSYAQQREKSVSQIVSDYFSLLESKRRIKTATKLPITSSLRGVLKGKDMSEKDYSKYLEDKFL